MKTYFVALVSILSIAMFTGCQSPVPSNRFSGTIGGMPFEFETRKQSEAEGLELTSISPSNSFTLKLQKLSSKNDAQVISKSYAGQAAVAREYFTGVNELASKLVEGGVKGAKGGL